MPKSKFDVDYATMISIFNKCNSFTEMCIEFNMSNKGGNINTLKKFLTAHNIDYSKMYDNTPKKIIKKTLEEHFKYGSNTKSHSLKLLLFKNNIKEKVCEICGTSDTWNNKPLSLHLHHKDGDSLNNTIDNLIILCPNCHSQTENYSGKSLKNKSNNKKKINIKYCSVCNIEIQNNKSGMCLDCLVNSRCPAKEVLECKLKEYNKNYSEMSKFFKVSFKTIKTWLKLRDIDIKKTIITNNTADEIREYYLNISEDLYEISCKFDKSKNSIINILKNNYYKNEKYGDIYKNITNDVYGKKVYCYELDIEFVSISEAARYIIDNNMSKCDSIKYVALSITRACKNKRNGYLKMKWEFV